MKRTDFRQRLAGKWAVLCVAMICLFASVTLGPNKASAGDAYDALRSKWFGYLTGIGYDPDTQDADISNYLVNIVALNGKTYWDRMDKSSGRTYLWSNLAPSTGNLENVYKSYIRIKAMALAYASPGAIYDGVTLYRNAALKTDLISALDWLNGNYYNLSVPAASTTDWYYQEIGVPKQLLDITVLLYDELLPTPQKIANYMGAIERFSPDCTVIVDGTLTSTGANRVWKCSVQALRAIIVKDGNSSSKLSAARDSLSIVLPYVTQGDGFYADGSFIQHADPVTHKNGKAYNGSYGLANLADLAKIVYLLEGSAWEVTDANLSNMYQWVYDSFEPFVFRGALMNTVAGRTISREAENEHTAGHELIDVLALMTEFAPAQHSNHYKSLIKEWVSANAYSSYYSDLWNAPTMFGLTRVKAIMNDSGVAARGGLTTHRTFGGMDRIMHVRPGYAFGVSMFSADRTVNYEATNSENYRGWFTAYGASFLNVNNEYEQYANAYWPTVDSTRIPGATATRSTVCPRTIKEDWARPNGSNHAGGVTLGDYGASGMELIDPIDYNAPCAAASSTLSAKKSWFMFDDELVALGIDITSTDGMGHIETTIDNRQISSANAIKAATITAPTTAVDITPAFGTTLTLTDKQWIHLGSKNVGYYFPNAQPVKLLRETRTGAWTDISARETNSEAISRNYLTMWFDHGTNPADNITGYAYVLMPNKTANDMAAYAGNPQITVLANHHTVQAVEHKGLGIIAGNTWVNYDKYIPAKGDTQYLKTSKKASIMLKENANDFELAVADPTQQNQGDIEVELNVPTASVLSSDPGVTVTQLYPTTKIIVNVNGSKGKSFQVKLAKTIASDGFDGQTTGVQPALWTVTTAANTSVAVANVPSAIDKSMQLTDANPNGSAYATKSFPARTGSVTAQWEFMEPAAAGKWPSFSLMSGSAHAVIMFTNGYNQLIYRTADGTDVALQSVAPDTWYRVKITANIAAKTYDIYVNDSLKATGVPFFDTSVTSVDGIKFGTGTALTGTLNINNVSIVGN